MGGEEVRRPRLRYGLRVNLQQPSSATLARVLRRDFLSPSGAGRPGINVRQTTVKTTPEVDPIF
jgi:hypothetical protein